MLPPSQAVEWVVAIPASVPPYFIASDARAPIGFAIDVFEITAEWAGIRFRYQIESSPAAVIDALVNGRADIAPYVEVNPDNGESLRFIDAVETVPVSVFIREDSAGAIDHENLDGARVGLIEGQSLNRRKSSLALLNPAKIVFYQQVVSGVYALMSGEIDALVHAEPEVRYVARNLQISDEIRMLDKPLTQLNYSVGVRAGEDALRQRLEVAFSSVLESDKYRQLYRKWFEAEASCSPFCEMLWVLLALIIVGVMVLQWRRARLLALMNEALQQQISDTTERLSEDNAYLQDLTVTDTLTGINNRRAFEQRLNDLILRAEHHRHPFSLMIFDIDDFKKVNDEFGHDVGDQVLMDLVRRVKNIVRDGDTLCRWGGEEFTILMPQTGRAGAINIAERCRRAVASEAFAQIGFVTISVGVTSYLDGDKEGQIFKRADDALYRAKREGKNCVIWYDRSS